MRLETDCDILTLDGSHILRPTHNVEVSTLFGQVFIVLRTYDQKIFGQMIQM